MNIVSVVAGVTLGVAATGPAVAADALAALHWTARPLVVLSDRRDDSRRRQRLARLHREKAGLDERAVAVLEESGADGPLRRKLGVAGNGFAVVLVGKDGGVKQVWREPVDPRRIFTVIDRMPMRRDEMKG